MKGLNVYTSQPTNPEMATFLLAVRDACRVAILPMSELPGPDLQRRQALRVERLELLESIDETEKALRCFEYGNWQPDAGRESGLKADLDALRSRLRAVETVLGIDNGGADNA